MAATDLSAVGQGGGTVTRRVSLPSSGGNARQVTLPTWARKALVSFKASDDSTDSAGSVASSGTDDTTQSVDAFDVGAGQGLEITLIRGGSIYVAGPASGYAHLALSRF